jgi:hypothetical protein
LLAGILPATLLAANEQDIPAVTVFFSPSCHRCIEVKQKVMPVMINAYKNIVSFEYRNVDKIDDYKVFMSLLQKKGEGLKFQVPLFYFKGKFLTAKEPLIENLGKFIVDGLKTDDLDKTPVRFDLIMHFKGFVPGAIILAGLQDGINPCAFTVIVFFISFLTVQGYRKRELICIGLAFIFAVFLTYLCVGLGILNFFYHFVGFWVIARFLNLVIGSMSILFGILAVYDFIKFKRTGSTSELILQLPKSIKERIHKVVGFFYRKTPEKRKSKSLPSLSKLIISALITGFLVSLLEAVCTGQMYLPTISFVLKASSLKMQALGYLLLYNIMFVTPLIVIFILALTGITSLQFAAFLKKHLGLIKILMAGIFFGLGIFLIWRA